MTSESGAITSPGYDVNIYPDIMTCTWTVRPTSGKSVRLQFSEFQTEADNDYLEVRAYFQPSLKSLWFPVDASFAQTGEPNVGRRF